MHEDETARKVRENWTRFLSACLYYDVGSLTPEFYRFESLVSGEFGPFVKSCNAKVINDEQTN